MINKEKLKMTICNIIEKLKVINITSIIKQNNVTFDVEARFVADEIDFAKAMILYCNMKTLQSLVSGSKYDQMQNKHLLMASTKEVHGAWREVIEA